MSRQRKERRDEYRKKHAEENVRRLNELISRLIDKEGRMDHVNSCFCCGRPVTGSKQPMFGRIWVEEDLAMILVCHWCFKDGKRPTPDQVIEQVDANGQERVAFVNKAEILQAMNA